MSIGVQPVGTGGAAALPKENQKCLLGSRIDVEAEMEKVFYLPGSIFCVSIRIGYFTAPVKKMFNIRQ